jgi:hypothetical protein
MHAQSILAKTNRLLASVVPDFDTAFALPFGFPDHTLLEKWATVYAFSTGSRMNRY